MKHFLNGEAIDNSKATRAEKKVPRQGIPGVMGKSHIIIEIEGIKVSQVCRVRHEFP